MPVIGELKTVISAQTAQFEKSIGRVRRDIAKLSNDQKKLGTSMSTATRMFARTGAALGGLAAGYLSVRSAVNLLSKSIQLAAAEQSASVVFDSMFGAGAGQTVTRQLRAFAEQTPFQLTELRQGAKILSAYVDSSEDLIPTMRILGDIAAGSGTNFNELARAWARNSQLTRLYTRDIREFTNRGIPVDQLMARMGGFTMPEFTKAMEEGKFAFNDLDRALKALASSGGKFGGLMEKESKTIGGQLSNMGDSFDNLLTDVGNLTVALTDLGNTLTGLAPRLKFASIFIQQRNARILQDRSPTIAPLLEQRNVIARQIERIRNTPEMGFGFGEELKSLNRTLSALDDLIRQERRKLDKPQPTRSTGAFSDRVGKFFKDFSFKARRGARIGTEGVADAFKNFGDIVNSVTALRARSRREIVAPRQVQLAGALTRGSSGAAQAIAQARNSPTVKEAVKHTVILEGMDDTLKKLLARFRTGVVGVIDDLSTAGM